MAVDIDTYLLELKARTERYDRDLRGARNRTDRELSAIDRRFAMTNRNLRSGALGMGTLLGGIGAYIGVQQIKDYADSWNSVTRSLEASESIFGMRLRSASDLNKLANEARIDNDALAKLYIRTAAATRELGASEEDVATATTTVAKALKLGSASASEQTSVMLQLSQALQKGKLDGDEFRSVMENAGVIQELLAEKLKVSKGEIVKMAAEGKLSVQALFGALVDGADKVDRIFRQMPATIGESLLVLNNNIEEYIGNLDKAYGTSEAMVAAVKALSDNIEPLADGAIIAGAALTAAFAPRLIASIAAMGVGIAAAAGPIGIIAGGLIGAAGYAELFGDEMLFNVDMMRNAIDQGADFETAWGQAFSTVGKEGVTLQDTFRASVSVMIEEVNKLLDYMKAIPEGMGGSAREALDVIKGVMNVLIGVAVGAVKAVVATFGALPGAIGEKVIDAVNSMLAALQALLDGATDGVNNLIASINKIPGVDLGYLVAPDLGQIANQYKGAGERAGEAFVDAASSLTRDWIGEMAVAAGSGLDGVFDRIGAKALENARSRKERDLFRQWKDGTSSVPNKPNYANSGTDKAAEKARRAFERDMLQLEGRIALQRQEADLIGRSAYEIERMRTKQELLNEARKAGVELTAADLVKIDALSHGMARAVTEAEALREAYEGLQADSKEFLSSFVTDMKNGTSASEALASALDRISDKLIDMAVDNLVEAALGGLTGRGGNATGSQGGSALLSLFGFAKGGVAANGKPVDLPRFARGGVSRSAAIFGEAGPEAAVPLPDGRRIPVDLRVPNTAAQGGPTQLNMPVTFNVENGTAEGIDKLKTEIVPLIRQVAEGAVDQRFERKDRYRRMKGS